MNLKTFLFMIIVLAAGCMMPIQAGINARLGRSINSPIAAAFISFAVGFLFLGIYLMAMRQNPFDFAGTKGAPWWIWTGGLLGAFFVSIATTLVPRLGATLSFSLIIAGQLLFSVIIDKYGLFGIAATDISIKKIAGISLVIAGVLMIKNS
jgi:transporter family-2 protein